MKIYFKRFCCIGMALLFSLGLFNFSGSAEASELPDTDKKYVIVAPKDSSENNVVITKEMIQEMVDQNTQKSQKSDKSAFVALLLDCLWGVLGIHQIYVGNVSTGIVYMCVTGVSFLSGLILPAFLLPIVDGIDILFGNFKDCKGLSVKF